MATLSMDHGTSEPLDSVSVIVEAFRKKFGDDAYAVAVCQLAEATLEAEDVWAAVTARLAE